MTHDLALEAIAVDIDDPAWSAAAPDAACVARGAARAALAGRPAGALGAVAILLTDDATLQRLNSRFRGQDTPTNVLAFPALAVDAALGAESAADRHDAAHLGDVALAFGVCAREAAGQGKTLADHLRHLTVHGVLHLLGYDHQAMGEAERMESLEREILAGLGVADPYA